MCDIWTTDAMEDSRGGRLQKLPRVQSLLQHVYMHCMHDNMRLICKYTHNNLKPTYVYIYMYTYIYIDSVVFTLVNETSDGLPWEGGFTNNHVS